MQMLQKELADKTVGAKRSIEVMQKKTAALLAAAESKSKKIARRAEKLPELAQLLQPFV